jgi:fatty-acyl-CoA synthase
MDFLSLQASLRPDATAIIDITNNRQLSYSELNTQVNALLNWFVEEDINVGDRVACLSRNRAEIVLLHLACGRAGVLFVPLNWRLAKEELSVLLADCTPKVLFTDQQSASFEFAATPIEQLLLLANSAKPGTTVGYDPEVASLILYTSGTTGKPKGIIHSEATIMESTINMMLLGQVNESSVFLCEAPMFHVIGLISCIRPALFCGGHLVITDGFQPDRTLALLQDPAYQITHYFCVPQMANTLRLHPDFSAASLKALKALLTGGAPHPEAQIRAWLDDGIPIVDGYGMSEAGTVLGMPFDKKLIADNAGFVGIHSHRTQVRIVNSNDKAVTQGQAGELQIRGKHLCIGIWQQAELFNACFTRDGWFRTGDIAIQNSQGFYRIVDRQKDMYISGGENVYPVEVESAVLQLPQVKECAVIGVADQIWGEVGCLYITYKSGAEPLKPAQLIDILKMSLAKYKLPKYIYTLDSLPRNASGKLIKSKLQADFAQTKHDY